MFCVVVLEPPRRIRPGPGGDGMLDEVINVGDVRIAVAQVVEARRPLQARTGFGGQKEFLALGIVEDRKSKLEDRETGLVEIGRLLGESLLGIARGR